MREGWEQFKLGDVITLHYGKGLPKEERDADGVYPAYGANGIKCRTNRSLWDRASIIVGRKGSAGEVSLVDAGFWALDVTYYIDIDESRHDLRFVYHLLSHLNLPSLATGVKPGINRDKVYSIESWFPPLTEQKRIVVILDEAFEAIERAEVSTRRAQELSTTLFNSAARSTFEALMAEHGCSPLGAVCENLDSRRVPITRSKREPGGIPYYGASGIVDYVAGHLFDEELLLISEDGANLLARTYPIAYSISGKSWVNNHAHVLRFGDRAQQSVVEYYLNSIDVSEFVSGMAQPKLNQRALNRIPVPWVAPSVARTAVDRLDQLSESVDALVDLRETRLAAMNELRSSLLSAAFCDELTVAAPGSAARHVGVSA